MSNILRAVTQAAVGGVITTIAVGAGAHGPVFSPAPETIWKGGVEITQGYRQEQNSGAGMRRRVHEPFVQLEYGITSNLEIGIEAPWRFISSAGRRANGVGDVALGAKYQFWKVDLPKAQYKAAVFFRVRLPTGRDHAAPMTGSGSTDLTGGLAAGYEGRRWYAFASALYRLNTPHDGLDRGDRQSLNIVGGIRPFLTEYDQPDLVLMLELNWQRAGRNSMNGRALANTGGWQLFIAPVIWLTYRQFAFRGGVQIPIAHSLNGVQSAADYRVKVEFVYHF